MPKSKLFEPIKVGRLNLAHRIAMAPLTRCRADDDQVLLPFAVEYYTQRASEPGTLLIAEASNISAHHSMGGNTPGIWTQAQVAAWRAVTDAVHERGCFIICQVFAPGRAGTREGFPLYSSSATPMEPGAPTPHEMTEAEIMECIADFRAAARSAMDAGFDAVELHGANGYLVDQFTQNVCNVREDRWGGSVENRSRFVVEVTRAMVEEIGADRVGVRLSPWNTWQSMKMEVSEATAQFSDVIRKLKVLDIAYLHLIESRVVNNVDTEKAEGLEFAFDIWQNQSPILVAGGYKPDFSAARAVDEEYKDHDVVVVFGRHFLSTPDLVYRMRHGLKVNNYDRSSFYTPKQMEGYIDYPFSEEFLATAKA